MGPGPGRRGDRGRRQPRDREDHEPQQEGARRLQRPRVRGGPEDPEAGSGPVYERRARQPSCRRPDPHPHGGGPHRGEAAGSWAEAVQEGDRDPARHPGHEGARQPRDPPSVQGSRRHHARRAASGRRGGQGRPRHHPPGAHRPRTAQGHAASRARPWRQGQGHPDRGGDRRRRDRIHEGLARVPSGRGRRVPGSADEEGGQPVQRRDPRLGHPGKPGLVLHRGRLGQRGCRPHRDQRHRGSPLQRFAGVSFCRSGGRRGMRRQRLRGRRRGRAADLPRVDGRHRLRLHKRFR